MASLKGILDYFGDIKARKVDLLIKFGKNMPDEKYIKKMYQLRIGKPLNLSDPKTYTEKLQWLKLYDRKPEYTVLQDKFAVRDYVSKTIGSEYLIPLLGVWNNAKAIDFSTLPNQFVLKCNHDCASVTICRDKEKFNYEQTIQKLNYCLNQNYYYSGREWAYKDIKPVILAEQYMEEDHQETLTDYKFFCFSGKPKMVMLTSGEAHTRNRRNDLYDIDFNHLPIQRGNVQESDKVYTKPEGFETLVTLAEKLAGNIPFIRVDFYLIKGHPYFGEVAFYPSAGFSQFYPLEWEEKIGSWIQLPENR